MAEMHLKAQNYKNAEDTLVTIKDVEKTNEKERKEDDWIGWKRERSNRQTDNRDKRKDEKAPRTVKFTTLVMPVDKSLA